MRFEFVPSFERSIKRLPFERKGKIKQSIMKFIDFIETGIKSEGLGLKRLKGDYWEIRATIRDRVVLYITKDVVKFIIAGNHDEIKNFLKQI